MPRSYALRFALVPTNALVLTNPINSRLVGYSYLIWSDPVHS